MGEAKRRKQLDPTFGKPVKRLVPAEWSLALLIGIDDTAKILLWQGEQSLCKSSWLEASGSEPETLERLERNGFLVAARSGLLVQLALLKPEAVQDYINNSWAVFRIRELKPLLVLLDGEESLQRVVDLWQEAIA